MVTIPFHHFQFSYRASQLLEIYPENKKNFETPDTSTMASNLPSSHERKTHETNHIRDMLKANSYKSAVISNILQKKPLSLTVPPPEQLVSMFFKWVEPSDTYKGFACLPYISSLTEPLTLGDYSITMKFNPFTTSGHL